MQNSKVTIGINQRISMHLLEQAVLAILNDSYSDEYAIELAKQDYNGENRVNKAKHIINKITRNNSLMPLIKDNPDLARKSLKIHDDSALVLISLVNSAYAFCYDVTFILGKYFHAQTLVSSSLLRSKLSAKYGTNRSVSNGLWCILPMLVDAGFVIRADVGIYKKCNLKPRTEFALNIYRHSFLTNNPLMDENYPVENNFYFEFLEKL